MGLGLGLRARGRVRDRVRVRVGVRDGVRVGVRDWVRVGVRDGERARGPVQERCGQWYAGGGTPLELEGDDISSRDAVPLGGEVAGHTWVGWG